MSTPIASSSERQTFATLHGVPANRRDASTVWEGKKPILIQTPQNPPPRQGNLTSGLNPLNRMATSRNKRSTFDNNSSSRVGNVTSSRTLIDREREPKRRRISSPTRPALRMGIGGRGVASEVEESYSNYRSGAKGKQKEMPPLAPDDEPTIIDVDGDGDADSDEMNIHSRGNDPESPPRASRHWQNPGASAGPSTNTNANGKLRTSLPPENQATKSLMEKHHVVVVDSSDDEIEQFSADSPVRKKEPGRVARLVMTIEGQGQGQQQERQEQPPMKINFAEMNKKKGGMRAAMKGKMNGDAFSQPSGLFNGSKRPPAPPRPPSPSPTPSDHPPPPYQRREEDNYLRIPVAEFYNDAEHIQGTSFQPLKMYIVKAQRVVIKDGLRTYLDKPIGKEYNLAFSGYTEISKDSVVQLSPVNVNKTIPLITIRLDTRKEAEWNMHHCVKVLKELEKMTAKATVLRGTEKFWQMALIQEGAIRKANEDPSPPGGFVPSSSSGANSNSKRASEPSRMDVLNSIHDNKRNREPNLGRAPPGSAAANAAMAAAARAKGREGGVLRYTPEPPDRDAVEVEVEEVKVRRGVRDSTRGAMRDATGSKNQVQTTLNMAGSTRRSSRNATRRGDVDVDVEGVARSMMSRRPALTREEEAEVILSYPPGQPGAVNVTGGDLYRLTPGEFLNDTLIEFGLKLWLKELEAKDPELADQVHVFNSFFYKKLNQKKDIQMSYESVKKWTNKIDIFKKKYVIVPINEHLHWYLAIIYEPEHILKPDTADLQSTPSARPHTRSATTQGFSLEDKEGGDSVAAAAADADATGAAAALENQSTTTNTTTNTRTTTPVRQTTDPDHEESPGNLSDPDAARDRQSEAEVEEDLQDFQDSCNIAEDAGHGHGREGGGGWDVRLGSPMKDARPIGAARADDDDDDDIYGSERVSSPLSPPPDEDDEMGEEMKRRMVSPTVSDYERKGRVEVEVVEEGDDMLVDGSEVGSVSTGGAVVGSRANEKAREREKEGGAAIPADKFYQKVEKQKQRVYGTKDKGKGKQRSGEGEGGDGTEDGAMDVDMRDEDEVLVVDDLPQTRIFTFDSLGGRHPAAIKKLEAYLKMEAKEKKGVELAGTANGRNALVPVQPNFCDCGVYLLHFAKTFMSDPKKYAEIILAPKKPIINAEKAVVWNQKAVDHQGDNIGRTTLADRIKELSKAWKKQKKEAAREKEKEAAAVKGTEVDAEVVSDSDDEVEVVNSKTNVSSPKRGKKVQAVGQTVKVKMAPAARLRG